MCADTAMPKPNPPQLAQRLARTAVAPRACRDASQAQDYSHSTDARPMT